MNIKEEIQVLLVRKGLSMRKLINKMNEQGYNIGSIQNLTNKFNKNTIRFNEAEKMLDFLGYEFEIKTK
jgi:hypothetical protein